MFHFYLLNKNMPQSVDYFESQTKRKKEYTANVCTYRYTKYKSDYKNTNSVCCTL